MKYLFFALSRPSIIQLHKLITIPHRLQELGITRAFDDGICVDLHGNPTDNAPNNQTKVRQMTKQNYAK